MKMLGVEGERICNTYTSVRTCIQYMTYFHNKKRQTTP